MRSLGLRALLLSVLLCGAVLVLGLSHSRLFVVLWVFWFPGIAVVAYPLGISGFDTELYPRSALLMVFVNVLIWCLVIYLLMRFVAYLRNRSQPK